MAITAWSAKVLSRSICFSLNGLISLRLMHEHSDRLIVAHQRHGERGAMAIRSA